MLGVVVYYSSQSLVISHFGESHHYCCVRVCVNDSGVERKFSDWIAHGNRVEKPRGRGKIGTVFAAVSGAL